MYKVILFITTFLFISTLQLKAQTFTKMQDLLQTVETAKLTYRQSIRELDDGLSEYIVVEVDTKGKEVETFYRFSYSDIDANTVRSITKKDLIIVQLLIEGKQKLIQKITDGGEKINYISEFQFLANNSENGEELAKATKGHIPNAIAFEEQRLSLTSYEGHMAWLVENIGAVELPKKEIIQKVSKTDFAGKLIVDQTFNAKSKTKNELRELNLATLNPNSVGYRIMDDEFIISVGSRRNIKGIRFAEDGVQKNYQSDLRFYAKSITNGKDIYKVLKNSIPLAEEEFEKNRPDVSNESKALSYLNQKIAEISYGEETISQNLSIQDVVAQLKQTETQPDKSTSYVFNFNFGDINANNIDYDGQKDRLFVVLPIKKSVDFVQEIENGELQNYTNTVKLFFNTIEDAIIGVEALKTLAANYEQKLDASSYKPTSFTTSIAVLKKVIQKVKIGDDNYDLFIEVTDEKTKTVKVTTVFSNLKKSLETIHEFSIANINPKNCEITIKGKHVIAELNTTHLEKIVKTYVDGEIKPYVYKVGIEAKGIEEARKIVNIFQSISN